MGRRSLIARSTAAWRKPTTTLSNHHWSNHHHARQTIVIFYIKGSATDFQKKSQQRFLFCFRSAVVLKKFEGQPRRDVFVSFLRGGTDCQTWALSLSVLWTNSELGHLRNLRVKKEKGKERFNLILFEWRLGIEPPGLSKRALVTRLMKSRSTSS